MTAVKRFRWKRVTVNALNCQVGRNGHCDWHQAAAASWARAGELQATLPGSHRAQAIANGQVPCYRAQSHLLWPSSCVTVTELPVQGSLRLLVWLPQSLQCTLDLKLKCPWHASGNRLASVSPSTQGRAPDPVRPYQLGLPTVAQSCRGAAAAVAAAAAGRSWLSLLCTEPSPVDSCQLKLTIAMSHCDDIFYFITPTWTHNSSDLVGYCIKRFMILDVACLTKG